MEHVGVRQFKDALSRYLARAARGETIIVTDRGRPMVQITSLTPVQPPVIADAIRQGRATWSGRKPTPPLMAPAVLGPGTVADLVVDDRR